MGITLIRMDEYNKAIQQFEKAISLNPLNPLAILAHCNLALIYKKIGLVKKAKKESAKTFSFISSNKEFSIIRNALGLEICIM